MSIEVSVVSQGESQRIEAVEEGQFSEVKSVLIKPADLSKTISAFANSDGGDLYIGIDEVGHARDRKSGTALRIRRPLTDTYNAFTRSSRSAGTFNTSSYAASRNRESSCMCKSTGQRPRC